MKDQATRPTADEDRVTALFFAETRNNEEVNELADYAGRLTPHSEIRNISRGPITAYVVSMMTDARHLLIGLDYTLRKGYLFGCVQIPYLDATYRFVMSLAAELGSELAPLPVCSLCGRLVAFPKDVVTPGEDGVLRLSDSTYCQSCVPVVEENQGPEPIARVDSPIIEATAELVA